MGINIRQIKSATTIWYSGKKEKRGETDQQMTYIKEFAVQVLYIKRFDHYDNCTRWLRDFILFEHFAIDHSTLVRNVYNVGSIVSAHLSYIKMYSLRLKPFVVRLRANISQLVRPLQYVRTHLNSIVQYMEIQNATEREGEWVEDLSDTSNKNIAILLRK